MSARLLGLMGLLACLLPTPSAVAGEGDAKPTKKIVRAADGLEIVCEVRGQGGPVALLAAKRMPGTVVAVIGVDTLQNAEFKMPQEVTKKFFEAFESDFQATLRTGIDGMLSEKTDPDLKKWILKRAEAQDRQMALGLMRDMSTLDLKTLLKEAKTPVRCINSAGGFAFFTPTDVAVNKK